MLPLFFDTAHICHIGARDSNEDAWGFFNGCWVVADGLGGHAGGEIASWLAIEAVLNAYQPESPISALQLIKYIEASNKAIQYQQGSAPSMRKMGTTLVILVSDGITALWSHIGDSRLYLFREGRIIFQTEDHSVPQRLVRAGLLAPEDIRQHRNRNMLTHAIGDQKLLSPDFPAMPIDLLPGDAFLLCSDGFWEAVTEHQMKEVLVTATSAKDWLDGMEFLLKHRANPFQDNYTALAIIAYKENLAG